MKNSTTVKLAMDATEPAQRVRVIVLTDKLSDRIGARVLPRQSLKLQKFSNHRFTPKIQVRHHPSLEAWNSESPATWQQLLENRRRHRSIWLR